MFKYIEVIMEREKGDAYSGTGSKKGLQDPSWKPVAGVSGNRISCSLLVLIMLLSLAVWLLLPLAVSKLSPQAQKDGMIINDAVGYDYFAKLIIRKKAALFADRIYDDDHSLWMTAYRTPIYPLFLAFLKVVTGNNIARIMALHTVVNLLNIVIIFLLAKQLFSSRAVGLIACALYGLDPIAIFRSIDISPDALFNFFFYSAMLLFIIALKKGRKSMLLAFFTGVSLAFSTLTKPLGAYSLPLFIIMLCFAQGRDWIGANWKKGLIFLFLLVSGFVVTLSPWQFRNYKVFGSYAVSIMQGRQLYGYSGIGLKWELDEREWYSKEMIATHRTDNESRGKGIINPFTVSKMMQERAIAFIFRHPVDYMARHFNGMLRMLFPWKGEFSPPLVVEEALTDLFKINRFSVDRSGYIINRFRVNGFTEIQWLYQRMIIFMTLFAFLMSPFEKKHVQTTFLGLTALFFLFLAGPVGYSRYKFLILAPLYLLAAYSADYIVRILRGCFGGVCSRAFVKGKS